jgi:hypothetical protein
MVYEAFIPVALAEERHRTDMVSLMLPAMVPNLTPTSRAVAMGVTAQNAVQDSERKAVGLAGQAVETATEVGGRDKPTLTDADLNARPALAAAVRAAPQLRAQIESAGAAIARQARTKVTATLDQAAGAIVAVAESGGPIAADKLDQFPDIRDALHDRNVLDKVVLPAATAAPGSGTGSTPSTGTTRSRAKAKASGSGSGGGGG